MATIRIVLRPGVAIAWVVVLIVVLAFVLVLVRQGCDPYLAVGMAVVVLDAVVRLMAHPADERG